MKTKAKQIDNFYNSKGKRVNNEKTTKKNKNLKAETINLDNEIIIGLTRKEDNNNKKQMAKTKKSSTKLISKKKTKKIIKREYNKNKKRNRTIKWTSIIIIALIAIILFLLSSLFNIKDIVITNNSKVTSEKIKNLSGLSIGENMFKFLKTKVKSNIKTNAYIEGIKINRNLNGTITIDIKERVATYMLKTEDGYVYINNQGYILEKNSNALDVPTIIGYTTENLQVGNRLNEDDLKKLDTIIQIIETAKNKEIYTFIKEIDISDKLDYTLKMTTEKKTVHFGNSTNINEKILWIKAILTSEKGKEGEIFVKDVHKTFFREKV